MKAKAWRLYGAKDMRLEDIELEAAGDEGIVVELVTNTSCLSDYKGVTLGTGHKRVQRVRRGAVRDAISLPPVPGSLRLADERAVCAEGSLALVVCA